MRIEILNWERFNPRKDVKNPSWFRLSHNLFEDPDFYDFTHSELIAWIYILSAASKKNTDTIRVNFQHLERVGRIKSKDFYAAVEKLRSIQVVLVHDTDTSRARYAPDTSTNATNERTRRDEHNEHADLLPQARQVFDFELLYEKYPRKEGKQKGMAVCKAQIRSQEDYDSLSRAVDRYAEQIKKTATDPKYVKHFSTFMASWRDWVDWEPGAAQPAPGHIDWKNVFGEEKDAG